MAPTWLSGAKYKVWNHPLPADTRTGCVWIEAFTNPREATMSDMPSFTPEQLDFLRDHAKDLQRPAFLEALPVASAGRGGSVFNESGFRRLVREAKGADDTLAVDLAELMDKAGISTVSSVSTGRARKATTDLRWATATVTWERARDEQGDKLPLFKGTVTFFGRAQRVRKDPAT
jgi:hypothetical protein